MVAELAPPRSAAPPATGPFRHPPPPRLLPAILKDRVWRHFYASWESDAADLEPGYALLLPVPGDLPVFFRLALANVRAQDPTGRVETIVIPDTMTPAIAQAVEEASSQPEHGPIRLVPIPPPGPRLQRRSRMSPANNYFLQVHAGISAATTTHVLLHDADLFLANPSFLRRHYQRCAAEELACLGVSPAWDDWLGEQGFDHVVATWELMLDVRWAREFAPWEHRPHHEWLGGEWHGFDVTLAAQARTGPERCRLNGVADEFVHFQWVIGKYRHFQRDAPEPFEDDRFTLLLIRLLSDVLGHGADGSTDVPPVSELIRGLSSDDVRVTYRSDDARDAYPEFRSKIDQVVSGPLVNDTAAEVIEDRLKPFDAALG